MLIRTTLASLMILALPALAADEVSAPPKCESPLTSLYLPAATCEVDGLCVGGIWDRVTKGDPKANARYVSESYTNILAATFKESGCFDLVASPEEANLVLSSKITKLTTDSTGIGISGGQLIGLVTGNVGALFKSGPGLELKKGSAEMDVELASAYKDGAAESAVVHSNGSKFNTGLNFNFDALFAGGAVGLLGGSAKAQAFALAARGVAEQFTLSYVAKASEQPLQAVNP